MMGTPTGPEIADLLGRLYDAALKPELWPRFLEPLARHLDGRSAALRVLDVHHPEVSHSATWNFTEDENRAYRDYFITVDPFYRMLRQQNHTRMQLSHESIPDRDYANSEFYADFFRHTDRFFAAGGFVLRDADRALLLGIQRSKKRGPFEQSDLDYLELFAPHLRRAADMTRLLAREDALTAGTREALDRLDMGVLLLNEAGHIVWANSRAGMTLAGAYPLDARGEMLTTPDPKEQSALRTLIEGAIVTALGTGCAGGGALRLIGDPEKHQPLVVMTVPISRSTAELWCPTERTAAIVYIGSPTEQRSFCHTLLRQLFGLTPAEARVTELIANGKEPKEVAAQLGSSPHTVRTQMKSIFQKTHTSRQSELVRLVSGSLTPLST